METFDIDVGLLWKTGWTRATFAGTEEELGEILTDDDSIHRKRGEEPFVLLPLSIGGGEILPTKVTAVSFIGTPTRIILRDKPLTK